VHVRSDGEIETIEVLVGRVILLEGGKSTAIGAGQGMRFKFGRAEIEHFRIKLGPATMDPAPTEPPSAKPEVPAPEPVAQAPQPEQVPQREQEPHPTRDSHPTTDKGASSESATQERGRADVTLAAGENAVVHDPKSALDIRLRFDHLCSGRATLEASDGPRRQQRTGTGNVVLRLRGETQRYRLRCAGSSSAETKVVSGSLRLLRDSGNLQLSRRAPVNTIEADGRHYTVLFQSRLPVLSFTWSAAPADAGALKLNVDVAGQVKVFATAKPRYELPSGALREGTYTWCYTTDDGRLSPMTTVTIRFDNAAPTAQFFAADGDEGPATGIHVKGVALEGTKVSVAGQPLTLDDHWRFRTAVAPPEGDDAVAVRLEHPRSGIHYYVRRPDHPDGRSVARRDSGRR
jgi:hypothetical protein